MKSVRITKVLTDYLHVSVCLLTQRPSLIERLGKSSLQQLLLVHGKHDVKPVLDLAEILCNEISFLNDGNSIYLFSYCEQFHMFLLKTTLKL